MYIKRLVLYLILAVNEFDLFLYQHVDTLCICTCIILIRIKKVKSINALLAHIFQVKDYIYTRDHSQTLIRYIMN